MDDTPSPRRNAAGQRSETDSEGGQRLLGEGCDDVADRIKPGLERHAGNGDGGGEPGRVAAQSSGPVAAGRPCLFPPGPSDREAWGYILDGAHDNLAPAMGVNEILARAIRSETVIQEPSNETLEPVVRGMADGLATRSRALKLLGNGVVPLVAAYAFRTLSAAHGLLPMDLEAETKGGSGSGSKSASGDV